MEDTDNGNPATEESPLMSPTPPPSSEDGSSGTVSDNEYLWQELEKPWPSTFERSISLLATPRLEPKLVEKYTKSPKPGSSRAALSKRSNLNRGFYTPDTGVISPYLRRSGRERSQSVGQIVRIQSLDFQRIHQEAKQQSAQAYRAKILQEQQPQKQQKEQRKPENNATFSQCAFNLANILMGVGLLGLPYCFKSAGWYGGALSVILFAAVTWRTSILIGRALNGDPRPVREFDTPGQTRLLPPLRSFPDIARAAFGETGRVILSVILYFELFSCLCIFLVAMGDHLHQLYPIFSVTMCQVGVALVSTIPTVLLHTPTLLSYLSMVGTFATMALVGSVILSAVLQGDVSHKIAQQEGLDASYRTHILFDIHGLTLALGLVAYCFSGHAIVPSIYTSMAQPSEFEDMVTWTFSIVLVCCLAVATSGYLLFGDFVQDQVTLSLEEHSQAVYAMKALVWLMILTAFSKITLTMFPLAMGMEELVSPFLTTTQSAEGVSIAIKLILTALALVVSIFVPNFSLLCALVGMVCTMSVSVIFPAAAHWRLFGDKLPVWERVTDGILVVLGVIMAIVGTFDALK